MRKQASILLAVAVGLMGTAGPLMATDRWVQGTVGSDTSDCSVSGNPCLTISYAVGQSSCGDTINIHGDSTYDESVSVGLVCTSGNELTLQNWSGNGTPVISSSAGNGLDVSGAFIIVDGIRFENNLGEGIDAVGVGNLVVRNSDFINNSGAGIQSLGGGGDDWVIRDSYFEGNGNRAIVFTGNNVTIDSNAINQTVLSQGIFLTATAGGTFTITNNSVFGGNDFGAAGIEIASTSGSSCVVSGNRVYDNSGPGIFSQQPSCTFKNNLVYNNTNGSGIEVQGNNVVVENNTAYGNDVHGVRLDGAYTGVAITNNILASNGQFGISDESDTNEPTESYNLFFANGAGACGNLDAGKCVDGTNGDLVGRHPLFVDVPGDNFRLSQLAAGQGAESPAVDSGSDTAVNLGLDGLGTRTDNATDSGTADMGFHYASELVTNYRSIGMNTGDLVNDTGASVPLGSNIVNLGAPLPPPTSIGAVGQGDILTINIGGNQEDLYIVSVMSPTQVSVQWAATIDHSGAGIPYFIRRAFSGSTAIEDWEAAREGDLVLDDRLEVGIAYKDAPFTDDTIIIGSTTDQDHFMRLTVAPGQRHDGTAGTGVLIDGGALGSEALDVLDDYTQVEWLEVKNAPGDAAMVGGIGIVLTHLLLHDNFRGIQAPGGGSVVSVRNSIIYNNANEGILGSSATPNFVTVENCTVFGNGSIGIFDNLYTGFAVTNTISMNNVGGDFSTPVGLQDYNVSSDGSASCGTCLPNRDWTDPPVPGGGPPQGFGWVIFKDLTPGSEDLHLQDDPGQNDAQDAGQNLSAEFETDIDGGLRTDPWDIGADEADASSGPMEVLSGSYTGDGFDDRFISVGFQPDVVIVKEDSTGLWSVMRTSTMIGDITKELASASVPVFSGGIKSLDPSGFTVGTDSKVNASGETYHWIAFKAGAGEMKVGSYTGDGNDNRSILGVGFRPDYVITLHEGANMAVHRSSSMTGDTSYNFNQDELGPPANAIQAFQPDGFQVGNDSTVNGAGTYHYVAWKATTGRIGVGTYSGDGNSSQILDIVGFQPEWLLVKQEGDSERWVMKPASTGPLVDYSLFVSAQPGGTDLIRALRPLGFEVGSLPEVNNSGSTFHWIAFAGSTSTSSGQVHYRWRNDDGDEQFATWAEPQDTKHLGLPKNTIRRLRFQVANQSGSSTGAIKYQLEVAETASCSVGSYALVPIAATTDHWEIVDSLNVTDGESTTDVTPGLSNGATTFVSGEVKDASTATATITLNHDEFTEIEYVIQATSNATDGGDYCFRLWDATNVQPLPSYVYAEVQLAGASCSPTINYRSIGTETNNLESAGTAFVPLSGTVVTFTGVTLPANVGVGDRIILEPGGATQIHYILSRDSDTQVTIEPPTLFDFSSGTGYLIERAYNTLQQWEDARDGDLVAQDWREVGVIYDDGTDFGAGVTIDESITDACHFMSLTVAPGHRHDGTAATGATVNGGKASDVQILIQDDYTQLDWLVIRGSTGPGITVGASAVSLSRFILYDNSYGVRVSGAGAFDFTAQNCIIHKSTNHGIFGDGADDQGLIQNCTLYLNAGHGIDAVSSNFTVTNTLSIQNGGNDINASVPCGQQSYNMTSDSTACGTGSDTGLNWTTQFVDIGSGPEDLHLVPGSDAVDGGTDLSSSFWSDIDGGLRPGGTNWDVGADELGVATAVELLSFAANAGDEAVELVWETGSEIDNVGFYLYRSESEEGPFELLNETVIPGLGSSPLGATYRYVDTGLVNGTTYFYELEDLESTGVRERHGPVSATPQLGASFPGEDEEDKEVPSDDTRIIYGEPEATSIEVLQVNKRAVVIELLTEGFYATPQEDGSVLLEVPGFLDATDPEEPAIPIKQAWVQALAGKNVRIVSVDASDVAAFSLRPSSAQILEPVMTRRGEVRLARRASNPKRAFRSQGLYPEKPAQLVSVAFQEEIKKALVELAPLRWDSQTGKLLLAKRLVVRLRFQGRANGELSLGGPKGKKHRRHKEARKVVAQLVTQQPGLYGVAFEDVFGNRRSIKTGQLRLTYQGEPVPYYVLPKAKRFGKRSVLYFLSRGEALNPYGREAVFELAVDTTAELMPVVKAEPAGSPVSFYEKTMLLEENHFFQGRLTTAPDIWLWDQLLAPVTKSYPFDVTELAPVPQSGSLRLWLQGTTDLATEPDHHLRVYVNGTLLDDFTLEGELAWHGELELLPGLLQEGENSLEIENVGDTGAAYSRIMLSRFEVTYPRQMVVEGGSLEGTFDTAGVAEVSGISGDVVVVDTTEPTTRWLKKLDRVDDLVRFTVEADHRYLVADSSGVLAPEVREPLPVRLSSIQTGAEYLVIAPEALLEAAWPLLELRASQGLSSFGVATEQIFSEFGAGETRPEAIRDFLEHAYHHWGTPPRYVVLLGDGTFDFKDYFEWGVENQVPPYPLKTTYIWTASDPAYALVNGDDILPDIALGRLPAANLDEARAMVDKILAFEAEGVGLSGRAVLIADASDPTAGDFEAHVDELAATALHKHEVSKIFVSELGNGATHDAILQAFDEGSSVMSFIGHGGMQLWNHNILRNADVDSLGLQAQQPLLFTMNCLNGYFQFPMFDSLAEALLKADGKGVLAAFSPSGLSLDGPAHLYHRLLLTEILHGGHPTLGDAILAAQGRYVDAGGYLELLRIYHLLGDPALRLDLE